MTRSTRDFPFGPAVGLDLDPMFLRLQQTEPVSRIRLPYGGVGWLVTRYADAKLVMTDARFSRAAAVGPDTPRLSPAPGGAASMVLMDPPEHTRVRRLVSKAFTPKRVHEITPRVRQMADELLADMLRKGPPADLVEDYALPLPVMVICELLGVPFGDQNQFREWSTVVMSTTAYTPAEVDAAITAFSEYLWDRIDERREHPGDDLLSALVCARDEGKSLSEAELVTIAGTLLVAGHQNTVNQIANFTYLLLADPELLSRIRQEPDILPTAIEELLRFVALGHGVSFARVATVDVELSGVVIAAGDAVLVSPQAANLDPAQFDDPGQLRLDRPDNQHMAFGAGMHHCLGAPLARMELRVAFERLLDTLPGLRMAVPPQEVQWKTGLLARGPIALPVAW
ncbi:cytochrome P450 [Rhizocola hellebori]|uniref:Cytochrome P450 n=1 Tax=Rhizocola hellebori TaxID=1392758 RepID=A0A8J3QEB3_9ACTN|nr:cytochrome P450 [Rhizocola hellebori]GIH09240.1 cytochrome P450 [Rhizocola hellebori]